MSANERKSFALLRATSCSKLNLHCVITGDPGRERDGQLRDGARGDDEVRGLGRLPLRGAVQHPEEGHVRALCARRGEAEAGWVGISDGGMSRSLALMSANDPLDKNTDS